MPTLVSFAFLTFGIILVAESSLAFLSLSVQAPSPQTWRQIPTVWPRPANQALGTSQTPTAQAAAPAANMAASRRELTASRLLGEGAAKPSSAAVASRSMAKPVPVPAPAPKGHSRAS